MRQRTWKEQSRLISELEQRNRALLADPSGAKEVRRLEEAIAGRDAAIARLGAKDSVNESLKAANTLLSATAKKSKSEAKEALRRCARLEKANDAAKDAKAKGGPVNNETYVGIKSRYVGILEAAIAAYERSMPKNPRYRPDGYPLAKRMLEYADAHLLFLRDPTVPFSNNISERQLRVSKGKMKQSGGFRSTANGERPYCAYLSVTETAKARGGSPHAAVLAAFSN